MSQSVAFQATVGCSVNDTRQVFSLTPLHEAKYLEGEVQSAMVFSHGSMLWRPATSVFTAKDWMLDIKPTFQIIEAVSSLDRLVCYSDILDSTVKLLRWYHKIRTGRLGFSLLQDFDSQSEVQLVYSLCYSTPNHSHEPKRRAKKGMEASYRFLNKSWRTTGSDKWEFESPNWPPTASPTRQSWYCSPAAEYRPRRYFPHHLLIP